MLFFVDESGVDREYSPYEVLAGISIHERNLWPLIQDIHNLELTYFGMLLSASGVEFKGKKLLKKKVFRFANQLKPIPFEYRTKLVCSFLQKGIHERSGITSKPNIIEFTAYGQAILDFVTAMYERCSAYNVKVFASMVNSDSPRPVGDFLRKDYAFLFERFFHYLKSRSNDEMGLVVFDEIDKTRCKRLLAQMDSYFRKTTNGRMRSTRIIPEPFFVHSDLTTAVQIADIVAYCLNWGVRLNRMALPTRPEMEPFGKMAFDLRYIGFPNTDDIEEPRPIYGIFYVDDLRPRNN